MEIIVYSYAEANGKMDKTSLFMEERYSGGLVEKT
jgi:hypothetical protein